MHNYNCKYNPSIYKACCVYSLKLMYFLGCSYCVYPYLHLLTSATDKDGRGIGTHGRVHRHDDEPRESQRGPGTLLHHVFCTRRALPVPRLPSPTHDVSTVSRCRASRWYTTQHPGMFPPMKNARSTHHLDRRNGPEHFLPLNPFPTLASYINLAMRLANAAKYHRPRPSSLSSISLASILSALPTASATKPVLPLFVVLSS